jgi:hypothetical protein
MTVPTKLITPRIEVPPTVEVPRGAKTVTLHVRTELQNDSDHDVVLHAPDEDAEIFWHVLDDEHREIVRERPPKSRKGRKGVETFRSLTIASGHSEHESEELELDAGKLRAGETYSVRAEIWGQVAEARFVAVETEPRPRKAAKKKASRKKAVKKKAKAAVRRRANRP